MDVFVSRPTVISPACESAYNEFKAMLKKHGIRTRRLGQSDYPRTAPLQAVMKVIDECVGAIILGYPQFSILHEASRSNNFENKWFCTFPTPWNQIEGALAYRANVPVLVVASPGVAGGIFDHGVTGESVLHLDLAEKQWFSTRKFSHPFKDWLGDIKKLAALPR